MTTKKKTEKRKPGRPKGALDMRSRNIRQAIQAAGQTPLEFMLDIMRDKTEDMGRRLDAAKCAAPYCHARLQSIVVQEKPFEGDPNEISSEHLAGIIARSGSLDVAAAPKGKRTIN